MLRAMIGRELRAILRSPKFAGSFAVGAALIVLSVFLGIQEYRAATRQYETATTLASQQLREETTWMRMGTRAFRRPEPMQIFVSGVGNDIGRLSPIAASTPVELRHSPYADDPIFAFFRMLDLVFLVGVVLSLFAILFTYDAISGERQDGTLKLALANRVPRARYLIAKGVGSWLALVVPLAIPVALSMLLLVVYRVPMDGERWMRLGLLLAASLLYFTFFLALGLLVSALTRRPSHSFLIALLLWVMLVLIIPRAGIAISSQIVPVPGVAEIEGRRAEFARDAWAEHYGRMEARLREERNAHGGPDREPPGEKET
ncbi:MAG: ABC transporter permease subunit, partial [Candidatus Eisenbacteria bacterium]|nr:ABC transporter permease subunit [Candidatus Eisenbacteria bacterium]